MISYTFWHNAATDSYEISRWSNDRREIVQTNIYTRDKARRALVIWRTRQEIHDKLRRLAEMEAALAQVTHILEQARDAS